MDYTSGEMGPSDLNYNFQKVDVHSLASDEITDRTQVNDVLVAHFKELYERHPNWTFSQIANGLHVDSSTLRQLELLTQHKLRSPKK